MSSGDDKARANEEANKTDMGGTPDGVTPMETEEGADKNTGGQEENGEEVMARARAYIAAKQKEKSEQIEKFKKAVKCDWLEYEAVRKKNLEQLTAWNCEDGEDVEVPELGSFVSTCDGRVAKTGIKTNLNQRRIVTTSFDVATGRCIGRTGHEGTKIWKDKRDTEEHK
jgi:hypothetical protein